MTEEDKTSLILRVEEWAAYFPVHKDSLEPKLAAISGETGIEIHEGERLTDLEVVPTQSMKHLPMPAINGQEAYNLQVKLVVFRATMARVVKGPLPDEPNEDKVSQLIMPPPSRAKRRKG